MSIEFYIGLTSLNAHGARNSVTETAFPGDVFFASRSISASLIDRLFGTEGSPRKRLGNLPNNILEATYMLKRQPLTVVVNG